MSGFLFKDVDLEFLFVVICIVYVGLSVIVVLVIFDLFVYFVEVLKLVLF